MLGVGVGVGGEEVRGRGGGVRDAKNLFWVSDVVTKKQK